MYLSLTDIKRAWLVEVMQTDRNKTIAQDKLQYTAQKVFGRGVRKRVM